MKPTIALLLTLALLPFSSLLIADDHEEQRDKPKPKAEEKSSPKSNVKPESRAKPKTVPEKAEASPHRISQPKLIKGVWLGVALGTVPQPVRDHLELPEGFGIQIVDVVEDSPAASAGLRKNDIIMKLDDQHITLPEHFQILVRSMKKGDDVTLSIIRKGTEEKVNAQLGETNFSAANPQSTKTRVHPPRPMPFDHSDHSQWQETLRRNQYYWKKQMLDRRNNPPRPPHGQGSGRKSNPETQDKKEASPPPARKEQADGKPPAISVRPGFPVQIFGSKGVVKIDNQEGELTLNQKDGKYDLELHDKEGKEVFNGPYDPEKGVKGLPQKAQDQLKKMKLEDLELILPKPADPKKVKDLENKPKPEEAIL